MNPLYLKFLRNWEGPRSLEVKALSQPEINVYGVIMSEAFDPEDITPGAVAKALKGLSGPLTLRINSPGGDAYAGIAIYNRLREYASKDGNSVVVKIEGLAASAASVIAMAGDEILMGEGAQMMIHDAWGVAVGPASEMRKMASDLDSLSGELAEIYSRRSGMAVKEVRDLMLAETYVGAKEAMAIKLADGKMVEDEELSAEETEEPSAEDGEDGEPSAEDGEDGEDGEDEEPSAEDGEDEEPSAEDGEDEDELAQAFAAASPAERKGMLRALRAAASAAPNPVETYIRANRDYIRPADVKALRSGTLDEAKGYVRAMKVTGFKMSARARQPKNPEPAKADIALTAEQEAFIRSRGEDPKDPGMIAAILKAFQPHNPSDNKA